ncbi:MAG: MBL fold metallo-hydrolase [Treponema sp.]|nr:MBL fold metallo-hydrolase [Treponema sp.]
MDLFDNPVGYLTSLLAFLREQKLSLAKILITHAHFEHIFALKELVERSGAEAYIHTLDKPSLTDNRANFTEFVGVLGYEPYVGKINEVNHGDEILLDEVKITVFHAPGHSPGSVYYMAGNAIFSGDVLSHNAIGHHNIPYANREDMLETLKRTVAIEGEYNVYPAHWTVTSLDHEKKNNLYRLPCVYLSHSINLDS